MIRFVPSGRSPVHVGPCQGSGQSQEAWGVLRGCRDRVSESSGQILPDPTHSEQEQRSLIIGHSVGGRLLLIVFTETDDRIRIISARDASARERREYEEHS
jgi:uncharacterized DUF497 family protein